MITDLLPMPKHFSPVLPYDSLSLGPLDEIVRHQQSIYNGRNLSPDAPGRPNPCRLKAVHGPSQSKGDTRVDSIGAELARWPTTGAGLSGSSRDINQSRLPSRFCLKLDLLGSESCGIRTYNLKVNLASLSRLRRQPDYGCIVGIHFILFEEASAGNL
ncbi:unnamed protein product [Protopolystoma xenopodis]|uniref:Uncharacterized protein n=1 Tax=Protopolystoma xenopodis TaxID=117903 RepID=A0A3S5AD73_9PLAT|nr:unnamed protein product [Protopolystoma xenopodis]